MLMTKNSPVALTSEIDHNSFLVPSLGFTNADAAATYSTDRDCLTEQITTGMDENFASLRFGLKTYVPRISSLHGQWLTSGLISGRGLSQVKWEVLRNKSKPMLPSAFNVCLLVDGPRQYSVYYPRTNKHPDWWYNLHMGERDCFAAWGRANGDALGRHNSLDGANHVVASTCGRGVIFARTAHFSNSGKPGGFKNIMVRVEFSVKDTVPTKDDMLRVQVYRHLAVTNVDEGAYDFSKDAEDYGWKVLIERAQQGFALHCETIPKERDEWRKLFIEQQNLFEQDKRTTDGSSYHSQVKKLDWQEALASVSAPWQLRVVTDVLCGSGSQFEESTGRHSAKYTRVGTMLQAHECTPERREQFQGMLGDYVMPAADDWNRTGD